MFLYLMQLIETSNPIAIFLRGTIQLARLIIASRHVVSIAIFATVFAIAGNSWAAQEICVEPESPETVVRSCITLSMLPVWLRKNVKRDAQGQVSEDVVVRLGEGIHRLANPVVIDTAIWQSSGRKLTIEGLGVDRTIISGAVVASTVTLPEGSNSEKELMPGIARISLKGLDIKLPDQLFEYRFGKPVLPDLELFANGKRLPRARWPNSGFGIVESVEELGGIKYTVRGFDSSRYAAESALMLGGYFAHDWADETLRSGTIDKSGVRFLEREPIYGVRVGQRVWFENALSDIDTPGEWAYDPTTESIYVLPVKNYSQATTYEVSRSLEGLVFKKVWNLVVKDIGLTGFRENAIRVDGGLDVLLTRLKIQNIGGVGVRLSGRNVVANDIHVADIGGGGIAIDGGSRITLNPGRVAVRNCTVARVGQLSSSYKVAVGISGVGNEVSNCQLSDGPHAAILFHGNDHLIADNLIERFVLDTDDAGAIYTGQDWTERGTIIRNNIIRHIGMPNGKYGANAIYLDDQASGIFVKDNLIINGRRGVMIGGGRDNRIEGNVFINCNNGIYIDSRGLRDIERHGTLANSSFRKKFADVNGASPQYVARYPELSSGSMQLLGNAGNNFANGNIFMKCNFPYVVKTPAQGALRIDTTYLARPEAQREIAKPLTSQELILLRKILVRHSRTVSPNEVTKEIP